jgi:putative ABC transport system ATP-binding protein
MNDTLIKFEGLTKVFLTDEVETRVLWDINLEIKRGDYVSIAGPSGCGKSYSFIDSRPDGFAQRR